MDIRANPGHRFIASMVLLAWLGWSLACPQAMVGVEGFVAGAAGEVTQTFIGSHPPVSADEDICCTALQHISFIPLTYAFNIPNTVHVFHALLPLHIGGMAAVFKRASHDFGSAQSPPLIQRQSPSLGALWPQAPPQ